MKYSDPKAHYVLPEVTCFLDSDDKSGSSLSLCKIVFQNIKRCLPPLDFIMPASRLTSRYLCLVAVVIATLACQSALAAPPAPEPVFLYTVRKGDELIKMSMESFSSPDDWKEIVTLNNLKNPDAIQPGQILKIPTRLMKLFPLNATLVSTSGDVQLGGTKVGTGTSVPEGSKLQTGRNSSAVLELADGSRVTMLPNTLAELATSRSYGLRGDTAATGSTNWFSGLLRLSTGVLETLAAKNVKRNSPLQIETPTSLVGVRGTQFRVAFDDPTSQNARTEVLEGNVRADNPAQSTGTDLAQGKGSVFNATVKAIAVVDLPKAPDLSKVPELIFKPQALWPMPAATTYKVFRVQIAGDQNFDKIVRDVVVKDGNAAFADLPNGQWFARIRSIRDDSIEGYDTVRVVQVMIPPQPFQPSRQWTITGNALEMMDGKQALRFGHTGLDASHAVVASVKLARPPFTRIGRAVFKGDVQEIQIELGTLEPNEPLELNLTVAQQDGAIVFPVDYAFSALATAGRGDSVLKRLDDQTRSSTSGLEPAMPARTEKMKLSKQEAAEEARQRAEELALARSSEKAQPKAAEARPTAARARAKNKAVSTSRPASASKSKNRKSPGRNPRSP